MDYIDHATTTTVVAEYEFDDAEESLIGSTASAMRWTAGLIFALCFVRLAVAAAVVLLADRGSIADSLLGNIVPVIFAALVLAASRPLDRIVATRGTDIAHLITAMGTLRTLFRFVAGLVFLVTIFCVIVSVIAFATR